MRKATMSLVAIFIFFLAAVGSGQAHAQSGPPPVYYGPPVITASSVRLQYATTLKVESLEQNFHLDPGMDRRLTWTQNFAAHAKEEFSITATGSGDPLTGIPGVYLASVWTGCVSARATLEFRRAGQADFIPVSDRSNRFCLGPLDQGSAGPEWAIGRDFIQYSYNNNNLDNPPPTDNPPGPDLNRPFEECDGMSVGFTTAPGGHAPSSYAFGACGGDRRLPHLSSPDTGRVFRIPAAGDEYRLQLLLTDEGGMIDHQTKTFTLNQVSHSAQTVPYQCHQTPASHGPASSLPQTACVYSSTESTVLCGGDACH